MIALEWAIKIHIKRRHCSSNQKKRIFLQMRTATGSVPLQYSHRTTSFFEGEESYAEVGRLAAQDSKLHRSLDIMKEGNNAGSDKDNVNIDNNDNRISLVHWLLRTHEFMENWCKKT